MTASTFDIVILGGGSGGYATALRASQLGLRVALVEKGQVGRHMPAQRLHSDQGTEDGCGDWRVEVEADDVTDLLDQVGVG